MHYSLLITSCNRHTLLRGTLDSFIRVQCGGLKPRDTFIIEDSPVPMPEWLQQNLHYYASHLGKITWINNDARMGQIYSADRLWSLCTQEHAFWMEDDWQFNEGSFMQESFDILARYPKVGAVSLRGDTGWHRLIDMPPYPFKMAMPGWQGGWGGFTFNCSVRRKSDYQRIGSYGRHVSYGRHGLGHEMELSKLYLGMGYLIADLNRPVVVHTGGSCSRATEPLPAMPRILIAIPACRRYEYGKWESSDSPHFNSATAYNGQPYGTDIHISGTNNRIQTVRETWARDVQPFSAHVDLRFFYGQPASPEGDITLPTQFNLQADEVRLPCPDDYAGLPRKSVEIVRWALQQGYDYMLKVDDDSYVWVDRAVHELMTNRFDYAGHTHHNVCTGGPGYWLSKRAMRVIAEKGGNPDHWAEDVHVAKTLNHQNIYPVDLLGHKAGGCSHWFDIETVSSDCVCIHALQPETMRELYKREHAS